jgi:fructosamine-3-kinase
VLGEAVGSALNTEVIACRHIKGGDFHDVFKVELADGRYVFAKTDRAGAADKFVTEAAGLEWLGSAGSVPVPEVLAVNKSEPGFLILEWIDEGRGSNEADEAFGRALARLHTAGAPGFGRQDARATGSLQLPNQLSKSWAEFYGWQRLRPLAKLAADANALPPKAIAGIDRLATRMDLLVGPKEPPARLHGDLWSGNRIVDIESRTWLVNPKAFGGDREYELAMMRLFGGFSDACFDAYDELFPLADGWRRRMPLYQLAPLINHAIRSGSHYIGRVEQALLQLR